MNFQENVNAFADFLSTSVDNSTNFSFFPSWLKFADVIPLHKKRRKNAKQNYRPMRNLTTLWQIYERRMFKQMSSERFLVCNNVF